MTLQCRNRLFLTSCSWHVNITSYYRNHHKLTICNTLPTLTRFNDMFFFSCEIKHSLHDVSVSCRYPGVLYLIHSTLKLPTFRCKHILSVVIYPYHTYNCDYLIIWYQYPLWGCSGVVVYDQLITGHPSSLLLISVSSLLIPSLTLRLPRWSNTPSSASSLFELF